MNKQALIFLSPVFVLMGCQNLMMLGEPLQLDSSFKDFAEHPKCQASFILVRNAYKKDGTVKDISEAYKNTFEEFMHAIEKQPPSNDPSTIKERKKYLEKLKKALNEKAYMQKSEHINLHDEIGDCLQSEARLSESLRTDMAEVRKHIANTYRDQEKELFLSRTDGRKFCTNRYIKQFSMGRVQQTPNKKCMYYNEGFLKAEQVTDDGILAGSAFGDAYPGDGHYIMIRTPNNVDKNIVDGQYLQSGYFAYAGVYQYKNFLASTKTVHSFKRMAITTNELFEDISFYKGF